jgi:hypothetical protein
MSEKYEDVDFSGLILGFSSAALHYMGEGLVDGKKTVELDLAKQNINIIMLLREKTKGNLSQEEANLIGSVLVDLQQKYAETAQAPKT